ncbi:MAG TPA: ABC transporter permease [Thermoanaerobaculia bacterium]|nr:ABC transporter permease [Thermoanaerobaculia bacterium]
MLPASESLETALHRFRTHPVQTWLTLAGLVVGTAAIIVIVTLGLTGRDFVMAQIEGVGSHLVWASYEGTVTAGVSRTLDDAITDADVRALSSRSDLFNGVTPLVELHGTVSVQSRAKDVAVLGTTPNYKEVRKNVKILRGRFLDEEDAAQRAKVCVMNRPLYEALFGGDTSPEKTVRTLGMSFLVVGEFDKPVDTMGQGEVTPESIFIPITVAWFFTPTRRVDTVFAEVRRFDDIPVAVTATEDLLKERHHQGSVFKVKSMTTVIKVAKTISFGLLVVFIVAAAVSVVVGGVGIMNILLASVEQRTREIGLRMSIGARRKDIRRQFLLEALMLGIVGASLGVLIGAGLPLVLSALVRAIAIRVSPLSAVLAFAFSCAVTVVFGVVPAVRAANLNPTEALRHE